jgi:ABC-type dipeptide/oligopeptide/nickel transport system ATPase component
MSGMINFYETKGVKKHMKKTHNPHFDQHHLKIPFRMCIVGASGSGKTGTLLNIIRAMPDTWEKIHIITKSKSEPLYDFFYEANGKEKGNVKIEEIDEKGLPDLKEFNSEQNSLIVLDDLCNESAKKQQPICDYFIRARKKGVSLIYITQSWFHVPKLIRNNLTYIVLKQVASQRNLMMIIKDFSLGADKKEAIEAYKQATADFNDFLLLDLDNPKQAWRKGLYECFEMKSDF